MIGPPSGNLPLLLVDVDGVLNALNRSQDTRVYDIFKVDAGDTGRGATVRIRHELSGWLSDLTEYYTLAWCSVWNDTANSELAPRLGLPDLPVIPCGVADRTTYQEMTLPEGLHWKTPAVIDHVGDQAYAWIDDQFSQVDQEWARLRTRDTAPTRHLAIFGGAGLQRHHVDTLITWAKTVSSPVRERS